ncbi:MAG TPA: DUF2877 domain-containing protein [Xanthobacteraceae bacterium]|nr:DUF2877 domain-containing protein [Xanthobacteraceae bacterium]
MSLACDRADEIAPALVRQRAGRPRAVPILRSGVLAREVCRRGGRGEVAAVFARSLFLRFGDAFVCIGEPAIGNGPSTLIIAAPPARLGVRQGQSVLLAQQRVAIGDLRFDLDGCETWRPPAWPAVSSPAELLETCGILARRAATDSPADGLARAIFAAGETPLARLARPRVLRFETWLSEQIDASSCPAQAGHPVIRSADISSQARWLLDRPLARTMTSDELAVDPVSGLVGLGPGLTPSGDDFLIGALAALDAVRQTKTHAALGEAVAAAAPARTSPLSASFLRAAAAGHAGENLHALVAAVVGGHLDAAAAAAGRIGHTSGWDTLAGVALTLRVVAKEM